jgi:hypothetical protein
VDWGYIDADYLSYIPAKEFSFPMPRLGYSIKLSSQIPRGGQVSVALLGFSMEAQSEWNIKSIISAIDTNEAKKAIKQIEEINKSCIPLSDILLEESYYIKHNIIETINFDKSHHFRHRSDPSRHRRNEDMMNRFYANSYIDFDNYFKQYISEMKKPYPLQNKSIKEPESMVENYYKSYTYNDFTFIYTFAETNRNLLLLTLALRAYYLDNHKYPDSLSQLCPAYLPTLPKDPFTVNKDFRYKGATISYKIYSIGPDLKDDNGKPFSIDPKKKRIVAFSNSKGDILLGMAD